MNESIRKHVLALSSLTAAVTVGVGAWANEGIPNTTARPAMRLPGGSYQLAGMFGESDEERAARIAQEQHEQAQDASIRYFRQRNADLENTVRRLTGENEQLDHRISELSSRMDRMRKDFEYRLCKIAAMQLNAAGEAPIPCMGGGSDDAHASSVSPPEPSLAAVAPAGPPRGNGAPIQLGTPPGALGTLPQSSASPGTSAPPPSPNRAKFDDAMRLMAKTQYDEARSAFRSFADTYPKDELAPQAVYWFGDIAYVQKDYPAAARAFAESIKKYPDNARAPDSMLKLGQSLIAMGQKQEGCAALAALPTKYPTASKNVIARAEAERKTSKCK
ncbi:MAG: tol-pal system protein YbgF [Alphaproteobacteria bacterium]|nr:tol-pal system protein YbgF [Alphaproteobacteria bacterium]